MTGFAKAAQEWAERNAPENEPLAYTWARLSFEAGAIWAQKYYLAQSRNDYRPPVTAEAMRQAGYNPPTVADLVTAGDTTQQVTHDE